MACTVSAAIRLYERWRERKAAGRGVTWRGVHRVRGDQVDTDAPRAGREQEEERARLRVGEAVDRLLARGARDGAVEPLEAPSTMLNDVLDEVEQLRKLREQQHLRTQRRA